MKSIAAVMASKFKFERSDRLDFDEWYSFLNILKEMGIESHYVDIAYEKSKNCFTYDDKNDKKHLFYKFIIFYIYLFFLLPTLLKKISSYRHSHCKIKVFL